MLTDIFYRFALVLINWFELRSERILLLFCGRIVTAFFSGFTRLPPKQPFRTWSISSYIRLAFLLCSAVWPSRASSVDWGPFVPWSEPIRSMWWLVCCVAPGWSHEGGSGWCGSRWLGSPFCWRWHPCWYIWWGKKVWADMLIVREATEAGSITSRSRETRARCLVQ